MPAVSAILIARNEESELPRALESLEGVADEIVLVDSGSTDRTAEIARAAGARVFARPFANFADQK
ncbi:MAG: glycosyltransferase, partial [Candidatus Acidiferrales bacterium]